MEAAEGASRNHGATELKADRLETPVRDRLFKTKGPLDPVRDRAVLIERQEAQRIVRLATQANVDSYLALLSPRQTGKTTLLYHVRALLREQGCGVAFVDLSPLEGRDEESCYRYVCRQILSDLGGQLRLPQAARAQLEEVSGPVAFRSFLWEVAHRARPARLVIMLDEVKAIPANMASAFFGTIRSVFSSRGKENDKVLAKYLFILAGAAELYELTSGENSPLNICEKIRLRDFDAGQVWQLVSRFSELGVQVSRQASDYLYQQTRGHPYLTQRVCSILEIRGVPAVTAAVIDEALHEMLQGDDNLEHVTRQLDREPKARALLREIVVKRREVRFTEVNPIIARLQMIGAISDTDPCTVRNPLYERALRHYFGIRPRKGQRAVAWVLAALLLLPLPTIFLYAKEVLLSERYVNQPIALPAYDVVGYVRYSALIGIGKEQEIEVEIQRPPGEDTPALEIKLAPQEDDVTSADGRYSLRFEKAHESQRFLLRLQKSARLQDILFPFLMPRERHVALFAEPLSASGAPRGAGVPFYTATMKVDYYSTFIGSLVVWGISLFAGIGSLLSHLDSLGHWRGYLLRLIGVGKEED